jgi:hypothetical protein
MSGAPGSTNGETVELLRAIWNEMKTLGQSFDRRIDRLAIELGGRIDATNARLDRVAEGLVRLEDRFDRFALVERRSDLQRFDALHERVARVEERLGIPPRPLPPPPER